MGAHLDDINAYADTVNSEISTESNKYIIKMLGYIMIVLLISFLLIYLIGNRILLNSTRFLEKEVNLDSLTKASSRRYGEKSLSAFYKEFKSKGESPAIMMSDLDDFKEINDKYGHDIGDQVLIEIVKKINEDIRTSDKLIRWGGDEFLGIFPGLKEEYAISFGKKIAESISSIEIPVGDKNITTSISIGFSFFKDTDYDYKDALKRADKALYKSKNEGKNKVSLLI